MKPDIILHVGTEKTGSTSIQGMLRTSYDALNRSKILFPITIGLPCHLKLTTCMLENEPKHVLRKHFGLQSQQDFSDFANATKQRLCAEIKKYSPKTLIISDEHINVHLAKPENLYALKKACDELGNIKAVIIYLRKQDDFKLSLFSQAVKSGNLAGWDILNPLPIYETIPYHHNYLAILDNLAHVFGKERLIPRIYDRALFPNEDVCADFINILGINIDLNRPIKPLRNRAIDGRIIKHLGLITTSLANSNNDQSSELSRLITKNCEKTFNGPGIRLGNIDHLHYMAQFSDQNKIVKQKYFADQQVENELFKESNFNNSHKTFYPNCTIPWHEFFIKYVVSTSSVTVPKANQHSETKTEKKLLDTIKNNIMLIKYRIAKLLKNRL